MRAARAYGGAFHCRFLGAWTPAWSGPGRGGGVPASAKLLDAVGRYASRKRRCPRIERWVSLRARGRPKRWGDSRFRNAVRFEAPEPRPRAQARSPPGPAWTARERRPRRGPVDKIFFRWTRCDPEPRFSWECGPALGSGCWSSSLFELAGSSGPSLLFCGVIREALPDAWDNRNGFCWIVVEVDRVAHIPLWDVRGFWSGRRGDRLAAVRFSCSNRLGGSHALLGCSRRR